MDDDELRRRPDDGRRRLSLSRRHFQRQAHPSTRNGAPVRRQPARTVVAQSHRLPHRAISRRRGLGDVHPAHHRLHRPQSPAAPDRLRPRRLRDELRAVAERLGLARGLVLGQLVMALDRMADIAPRCLSCSPASGTECRARSSTWRCCATSTGPGSSMPASVSRFFMPASTRATGSTGTTTASSMACCFRADCSRSPSLCASCGSRSRSSIFGCSPRGACADPALACRLPLHHPLDRLYHSDLPSGRAELSGAAGRRRAAVDRAAAVRDRPSARLASFTCRRALGACVRRDFDRRRLAHGNRLSRRIGRPTISCPRRSCRRSASRSR